MASISDETSIQIYTKNYIELAEPGLLMNFKDVDTIKTCTGDKEWTARFNRMNTSHSIVLCEQ